MQVKVYFVEEGRLRVVDTTAMPSGGAPMGSRGWEGPVAAMAAVDELDAADPYARGVSIVRSVVRWDGELARAGRVPVLAPAEADLVSEVYADGTLVLVRSDAGELVTVGRKRLDDEALTDALGLMGGVDDA